jgi:hypothetical protein
VGRLVAGGPHAAVAFLDLDGEGLYATAGGGVGHGAGFERGCARCAAAQAYLLRHRILLG